MSIHFKCVLVNVSVLRINNNNSVSPVPEVSITDTILIFVPNGTEVMEVAAAMLATPVTEDAMTFSDGFPGIICWTKLDGLLQ